MLVARAQRYHRHYRTTEYVWQGRDKAFPVQDDDHSVGVLRYVERNALRAELVTRAEDWTCSSLPGWLGGDALLWRGAVPVRDSRWLERVNKPLSAGDPERFVDRIRLLLVVPTNGTDPRSPLMAPTARPGPRVARVGWSGLVRYCESSGS